MIWSPSCSGSAPVNDSSYIQTVMHLSYFRKDTNDICMTLLEAPYWGRHIIMASNAIIGISFWFYNRLQIPQRAGTNLWGQNERLIRSYSSTFQRQWAQKTREWLNNSWELPTPQHFKSSRCGDILYAALTDGAGVNSRTVCRHFPFLIHISKCATLELSYTENTFPM